MHTPCYYDDCDDYYLLLLLWGVPKFMLQEKLLYVKLENCASSPAGHPRMAVSQHDMNSSLGSDGGKTVSLAQKHTEKRKAPAPQGAATPPPPGSGGR